jgi:hypothetical protein
MTEMNIELYRHKKTKGLYSVVCIARIEATGEQVTVYKNISSDEIWVRPSSEFNDGRFEKVVGAIYES